MKRLLPLILLALCAMQSTQAQIRVFKDMTLTEEIKNGDIITFTTAEEDPLGTGEHIMGDRSPYYVPSDLATATPFEVEVTLNATSASGYRAYWCGVGTVCANIEGSNERRSKTTSGSVLNGTYVPGIGDNMNLEVYFTAGQSNRVTAKVDVTSDGEAVLTYYIVYNYDGTAAAINDATANGSTFSYVGNAFAYNFATAAPRTLNVYAADGRLVKAVALTSAAGNYSLAGLTSGAYVWQLTENGRRVKAGKVLVK